MTAVRIDVTFEDIARGERCKFHDCAIALAAGRALPGFAPGVEDGLLWLYRSGTLDPPSTTTLPPEALAFVRAFDGGCAVKPFSFEVDRPC